ncbi:MAG: ATP-binding protein [Faecalicoccus sp.]|nr:ATP-binding protein [Faecalicoccus sp.]
MIGRKEEKQYLQSLLDEDEPQFVAVFGRRRIGKTYLVRESFNHRFTFQHTGVSNTGCPAGKRKQMQLDRFAESLEEYGMKCDRKLSSWNEAFAMLKQLLLQSKDEKKVIFLDELSWMSSVGNDLISALESFWNGWATARREKDIILIVCASATYWMTDNIVNAKGGLHNRLTGQIHLKPFTLAECEQYLNSRHIVMNRYQILQCYMIMGGVPYYWSLLRKGKSLPQNIDDLFFKEGAVLGNEYDNLYKALFNKPEQYIKIIEALSVSGKGLTRDQIIHKTGIGGSGALSKKLTELENCGFIRRYIPYGYKKRESLYQIIDNYSLFYYRFIRDKSFDENYWKNQINSPKINAWSGVAFEKVCLEHVPQIKKALGISGVYCETNAWSCPPDKEKGLFGSQIDLLIARKDQVINLCEMKYTQTEYMADAEFDRAQRRKISDFQKVTQTKSVIHLTLITTYGLVENAYSSDIQAVITGDDLFA